MLSSPQAPTRATAYVILEIWTIWELKIEILRLQVATRKYYRILILGTSATAYLVFEISTIRKCKIQFLGFFELQCENAIVAASADQGYRVCHIGNLNDLEIKNWNFTPSGPDTKILPYPHLGTSATAYVVLEISTIRKWKIQFLCFWIAMRKCYHRLKRRPGLPSMSYWKIERFGN